MNPNGLDFQTTIGADLARKIADSQKDLGSVGKDNMFCCLSSKDVEAKRVSFDRLDSLSQRIVETILTCDDLESAYDSLIYDCENLHAAARVLNYL